MTGYDCFMSETNKTLLTGVFIVTAMIAAFMWFAQVEPTLSNQIWKFGSTLAALLSLGLVLWGHLFRADKVPDFLARDFDNYLEKQGLAFILYPAVEYGVCFMELWYQNRHASPCSADVVVRPARGFWLIRSKFVEMIFHVEAEPAAYGVVRLAIPVAEKLQGKEQMFEIGAKVKYPDGRGKLLRFKEGSPVGTLAIGITEEVARLVVGLAYGGLSSIYQPGRCPVVLPEDVATELPDDLIPSTETLWRLGDENNPPSIFNDSDLA